jgi:hypothetical protein
VQKIKSSAMSSPTRPDLPLPPRAQTADGNPRRIGVELEFGGLPLARAAQVVAETLGGRLREDGRYERAVTGDPAGDWQVEIDFALLKELGRRQRDPEDPIALLEEAGENALRAASEWLVPVEVVSPPLPMERLGEVEALIGRLRQAGALGTREGLAYAFGLQLNPEMPDTTAPTILGYLKAFLCLYDFLRQRAQVDFTRRLTSFAEPFPKDYVRRVIDPDYRPELTRLMDDYLEANPTRNRALDLLPLFAHLDQRRVRAAVADPLVKARPTLHYRLPNCEIDRPNWGLRPIWHDWLQVEHLAADDDRLTRLCAVYARFLDRPLSGLLEDWPEQVKPWLQPTRGR